MANKRIELKIDADSSLKKIIELEFRIHVLEQAILKSELMTVEELNGLRKRLIAKEEKKLEKNKERNEQALIKELEEHEKYTNYLG